MPSAAWRRAVPSEAPWGTRLGAAIRFAVPVGIAAWISGAILLALPRKLHAHTDVVGSTTFTNFDVDFYFNVFYIAVIVFPLTALGLFLAVTWAARRLGVGTSPTAGQARSAHADDEPPSTAKIYVGQAVRLAATGAVLGLEGAIVRGSQPAGVWKLLAVGGLGFAVAAIAVAVGWRLLGHDSRPMVTLLGRVNALASPLVLVGLLAVSAATQLTVLSSGTVHH